jgi:hypothetical protein
MKNKINFIKHLAVFLFSLSLSAQVSISFQNVEYTNNGEPKRSGGICGTIDLRSSTSTLIEMNVNILTVRSVINNTDSELYVYSQKSPLATRIQRHLQNIPSSNFAGVGSSTTSISWSRPISFFINAADYNQTGGTLFLIFKSPGGLEYRFPCTIPIIKAPSPSFTLAPTTVGLACGDTASRIFTVTAANIPPGVAPSYSWSAPGWIQVGPTTNSATFQPSSGSILPGPISVTPSINSVAQPTMTRTVTRVPFTSTAAISGADAICTIGASAIYTINAGSGNSVIWSSSNTAIATLSNATNSQVTITRQAPGEFILNATITNQCYETVIVPPRTINGSIPQFNSFTFGNEFLIPACFSSSCLTTGLQSAVINASFTGMSASEIGDDSNWEWVSNNGLIFLNSLADRTQVCPLAIGSSSFKVRAKNACGWSDWVDYQLFDITECPFNFRTSTIYTVYPNPSKDIVNIELKDSKIQPEKEAIVSGTLFDLMGQSRGKVQIKNNSASLSVAGLKKGIYVLNINIDGKVEGHQVIVE